MQGAGRLWLSFSTSRHSQGSWMCDGEGSRNWAGSASNQGCTSPSLSLPPGSKIEIKSLKAKQESGRSISWMSSLAASSAQRPSIMPHFCWIGRKIASTGGGITSPFHSAVLGQRQSPRSGAQTQFLLATGGRKAMASLSLKPTQELNASRIITTRSG